MCIVIVRKFVLYKFSIKTAWIRVDSISMNVAYHVNFIYLTWLSSCKLQALKFSIIGFVHDEVARIAMLDRELSEREALLHYYATFLTNNLEHTFDTIKKKNEALYMYLLLRK